MTKIADDLFEEHDMLGEMIADLHLANRNESTLRVLIRIVYAIFRQVKALRDA